MFLLTVGVIPTPAAQADKLLCFLCNSGASHTQKVQQFGCPAKRLCRHWLCAVSYTHLTLPTIYSV